MSMEVASEIADSTLSKSLRMTGLVLGSGFRVCRARLLAGLNAQYFTQEHPTLGANLEILDLSLVHLAADRVIGHAPPGSEVVEAESGLFCDCRCHTLRLYLLTCV